MVLSIPVGIPNSFEPLPNPLTTMPLAKNGKQPSVLVVGISNFGECLLKSIKSNSTFVENGSQWGRGDLTRNYQVTTQTINVKIAQNF